MVFYAHFCTFFKLFCRFCYQQRPAKSQPRVLQSDVNMDKCVLLTMDMPDVSVLTAQVIWIPYVYNLYHRTRTSPIIDNSYNKTRLSPGIDEWYHITRTFSGTADQA